MVGMTAAAAAAAAPGDEVGSCHRLRWVGEILDSGVGGGGGLDASWSFACSVLWAAAAAWEEERGEEVSALCIFC